MKSKWFMFVDVDGNSKSPLYFRKASCSKVTRLYLASKRLATTVEGAFEKSIEKWQWAIEGYTALSEIRTCGFCDLFHSNGCVECPIMLKTGRALCSDTPFMAWNKKGDMDSAQAELSFLKILYKNWRENGSGKTRKVGRRSSRG